MSNNTGTNKTYRKKVVYIVPRDPKTGRRIKSEGPKKFNPVVKYHYKEDPKTGKLRRVTPDGKPWKPLKPSKPKPFIYPRDPKTGKLKEFTPKLKKMKGGKY
tara:strand:- start:222 stop:527 length:306 start_codon:yes stop_codon:yes gene_type:complete